MVLKTELLPLVPNLGEPAPTVTVYAVPKVAIKADSGEVPPPEPFGVGVGADEV
jgi:hypothetical protein